MIINIILWLLSVISVTYIEIATKLYVHIWTIALALILVPIFYILIFFLYLLLLLIWSFFINKKEEINKPNKFYYWLIKETCYILISLSRSKIHISGLDKLPSNGRVLIVSNHTSNFDQIVMMKVLKISPIIFVTKPQNENIPIAGAFIHKAGFVTLDRGNDFNAARSISKCIKYIEDDLGHIAICPEGTRSKTGELLNFKAGSYKIAIKSEAPIVVLALSNCNQIHKNFFWKRTDVYFDIVDCLYYENYKSMNSFEIAEKTKNEIRLKLEQRKEESNNELYFI